MKNCIECEHLKILYGPLRSGGVLWDMGRAKCKKYGVITDFASMRKFREIECYGEKRRMNDKEDIDYDPDGLDGDYANLR